MFSSPELHQVVEVTSPILNGTSPSLHMDPMADVSQSQRQLDYETSGACLHGFRNFTHVPALNGFISPPQVIFSQPLQVKNVEKENEPFPSANAPALSKGSSLLGVSGPLTTRNSLSATRSPAAGTSAKHTKSGGEEPLSSKRPTSLSGHGASGHGCAKALSLAHPTPAGAPRSSSLRHGTLAQRAASKGPDGSFKGPREARRNVTVRRASTSSQRSSQLVPSHAVHDDHSRNSATSHPAAGLQCLPEQESNERRTIASEADDSWKAMHLSWLQEKYSLLTRRLEAYSKKEAATEKRREAEAIMALCSERRQEYLQKESVMNKKKDAMHLAKLRNTLRIEKAKTDHLKATAAVISKKLGDMIAGSHQLLQGFANELGEMYAISDEMVEHEVGCEKLGGCPVRAILSLAEVDFGREAALEQMTRDYAAMSKASDAAATAVLARVEENTVALQAAEEEWEHRRRDVLADFAVERRRLLKEKAAVVRQVNDYAFQIRRGSNIKAMSQLPSVPHQQERERVRELTEDVRVAEGERDEWLEREMRARTKLSHLQDRYPATVAAASEELARVVAEREALEAEGKALRDEVTRLQDLAFSLRRGEAEGSISSSQSPSKSFRLMSRSPEVTTPRRDPFGSTSPFIMRTPPTDILRALQRGTNEGAKEGSEELAAVVAAAAATLRDLNARSLERQRARELSMSCESQTRRRNQSCSIQRLTEPTLGRQHYIADRRREDAERREQQGRMLALRPQPTAKLPPK